ncbi:MAG TPA: hypothetical protein DCS13_08855 [Candidatus Margulisbacteria bacterium]|nr:MAG: hypothetical protein A2X43_01880 [Candidatus Margulisbacteria bacterium GWD2_39_127]HAR63558.1 hypothetical protein [Candidatus Margulisiibacteriota bacterium]
MGFNPLQEKGIAIDDQISSWSEVNMQPYDKNTVDPYTRARIILMNGIEVEAALFSHMFARHTSDPELKQTLALGRRLEQQQQKMVNWMVPGNESTLEVTIGYEQVAVDLTAYLARTEPDSYVKAALDFGLLEDFDHLYRYANLMMLTEGKEAASVTKQYTEIIPGRPTIMEHRFPFDDVRRPINKDSADILTKLHLLTIVAGEQQTMNYYMNVGNRFSDMIGRGLYAEIGQIEEAHVTHYESLMDPTMSWFEQWLLHEYNECYLYYSFMLQEPDPRIRSMWERNLRMEIEHLKIAADMMRRYEGREPESILPQSLPAEIKFESNVDYVREVLANQVNLTAMGTEFVPFDQIPPDYRYFMYQNKVNSGGAPSEMVIRRTMDEIGRDYRQELAGSHPVQYENVYKKAA